MKAKRILSLLLAVAMLLSVAAFNVLADETEDTVATLELTDIDPATKEGEAVKRLVSLGIINGYPDGTFRPTASITRAEFCVVMVKFIGMQDYINPSAYTGFEDLDTDENYAWARPYVAMAVQRGVINGFEDKTFRAADPVTYEQAIKMIVCSLGYTSAATPTIPGDWSSGYIAKAMNLKITNGTSITNKSNPTTRGTVAVLVNNAVDAKPADSNIPGIESDKPALGDLDYKEIKGLVTGTYITELETGKSTVPKNHIMIDDEIYEIGFSENPNTFLGCQVEALVKEADNRGDSPIVTSLEPVRKNTVITVEADELSGYEDGIFYYYTDKDRVEEEEVKIADEYITIYNGKSYDYDIADLKEKLKNGSVDFVDNTGDKKADVIRINSYQTYVVSSRNTNTQKITVMYDAEYKGETTVTFPEDSTKLIFSLTRNGKEIKFSDIAKWDVLNIKESPEDAEGRQYYEVVVTRETVSGEIEERDAGDERYIVIAGKEYKIADSFMEYDGEDKPEMNVGDNTQVYLDAQGRIVAAAETRVSNSAESYAYLLSLRQDSDNSEYDLEFWLYTTKGQDIQIGSAEKITIDGKKYKALDEDIVEYFEETALMANANYSDAENVIYQQPVIYQTNSEGLVSVIHTVNSDTHEDISMLMEDEDTSRDDKHYYAAYDERQYKSSSKSFTDFKVSSSTKIMFIPDNRANTDDYLTFSSYSKAFANAREYHVEAYGLTSSGTASLVLIYKQNDSRIYTSSTPFLIVAGKSQTAKGTMIKGYAYSSYSMKTITVSEEDGPSISAIGKGDIIRYITDSRGELVDYQIWFDASDPTQLQSVTEHSELYDDGDPDTDGANRIIEIHSTSVTPRENYPTATFRLHYGTVTEIILKEEGDTSVDEETITISPVITEDGLDMDHFEQENPYFNSTISENISSSVKVFAYDRSGRNSDVIAEASLEEILPYVDYGDDATRVIAYTASGTLRMVYIINE